MDSITAEIKFSIKSKDEKKLIELLNNGLDPNFQGGLPIRLAARQGLHAMVKVLLQFGANPHLTSESGASTLQLAVYSKQTWLGDNWDFLLSFCDSSQLADGAAVAIIFHNLSALEKIMRTGRCNTNIPTTLTGKTVEQLAKGYKLQSLLSPAINTQRNITPTNSPNYQRNPTNVRNSLTPTQHQMHKSLSPSVARFFDQTATQTSLMSPRNRLTLYSPTHS